MSYIPQNGGPHIPYGVLVANGHFSDLSGIHKYGYNADIDTTYETVWEKGGAVSFPSSAAVVSITSATESASNSGVLLIVVGLDNDYNQINDTISLDASGAGSTTKTFRRVNRAFVGSGTNMSADVDLEIGSDVVAKIDAGHQQTLQCIFTVPAGKTAYLVQLTGGVSEKEKQVEMRVLNTKSNGVYRTLDLVAYQTNFFKKSYQIPVKFNEKTDIEIQAKCVGNASISASFDLILEDN